MTESEPERQDDAAGRAAPVVVVAALPSSIVTTVVDALGDAAFAVAQTHALDDTQAALVGAPAGVLIVAYPLTPILAGWIESISQTSGQLRPGIFLLCDPAQFEAAANFGIGDLVSGWDAPRGALVRSVRALSQLTLAKHKQPSATAVTVASPDVWTWVNAVLPFGLLVVDDSMQVVVANQAAAELLSLSQTQLSESNLAALLGEFGIVSRLRSASPDDESWLSGDFARTRKNDILEIDCLARRAIAPGKHLIVLQDATERNRREALQNRSEKLDSLGRLVGGMAHEFNNLLTVILGYSDLSIKLAAADSRFSDALAQIKNSAERGAQLTQLLLAYGRKQVMAPVWTDLNRLVVDLQDYIQQILGSEIELRVNVADDLPQVFIDPMLVQRALVHIVVNARDALPQNGMLTLSTSLVETAGPRHHPELQSGRYVCLSIQDNGPGIPTDIKPFIFEPFFTTKSVGKGVGLGLAFVDGVMHQSGGSVDVVSEPGQGSTFRLYFPTVGGQPHTHPVATETAGPTITEATILWVDDDEGVRKFGGLVLRNHGYQVLEAADGAAALSLVREHLGKIDLVVTDVYMPVMGGVELGKRLAEIQPDLPVLYQSGRLEDMRQTEAGTERTLQFLTKPFTREALLAKVGQLVRQRAN